MTIILLHDTSPVRGCKKNLVLLPQANWHGQMACQ